MKLFNLLGDLLDSTEETIKDTSKNIVEKTPGLVTSAGKIAVNLAQKGMVEAGKKISKFQSEEFITETGEKNCENQETAM